MRVRSVSLISLASLGILCGVGEISVFSAPPTLSYQGRITDGGDNYTGNGYFRFRLTDGGESLWSNDGSAGMSMPGESVTQSVNYGLFSVELGGNGMNPIHPLVFHHSPLWLRTWFSTDGSRFEQLSPDVEITPQSFAHFNTANLIIVDPSGNADFSNLQDAVDYLVDEDRYDGVLLMPGWHELDAPLDVPRGRFVSIRGLSRDWVTIVNTNGTALVPFQGTLSDVQVQGAPAIDDTGATNSCHMQVRNCVMRTADETESPTVRLATHLGEDANISLTLSDCEVQNWNTNTLVVLGGNARLSAAHTSFDASHGDALSLNRNGSLEATDCSFSGYGGSAVVIRSDFDSQCELSGCVLRGGDSGGLRADNAGGWVQLRSCRVESATTIRGGSLGLEAFNCQFESLIAQGGSGYWDIRESRFSGQDGSNAVLVVDREHGISLRDCNLYAHGATALRVSNTAGQVQLQSCDVNAQDAHAVEISVAGDFTNEWASARFTDCRLGNHGDPAEAKDCIVINSAATGDVELWVEFKGGSIYAGMRDGITASGAGFDLVDIEVNARRTAAMVRGGAEVELLRANIEGAVLGLDIADGFADVSASDIIGEAGALRGSNAFFIVENSTAEGVGGPALECDGGGYFGDHTLFESSASSVCVLREPVPLSLFSHCTFMAWSTNSSLPVISIGGTTNSPVLEMTHCMLRALAATSSIDVAGVATGGVKMVNTVLPARLSPKVTLLPPPQSLQYGNHIMPTPSSWWMLRDEDDD